MPTEDELRQGFRLGDWEVLPLRGVLRKGEHEDAEKGYQRRETYRGRFHRTIRLGTEVDEEAVKAVYKAGVLTVTLPKRAPAEPSVRSIPITSA